MNVLIAGGFWAIAKFMVLLCCTIVSMIKAIYFYVNTVKKMETINKNLICYDSGTVFCKFNNYVGRGF